MSRRKKIAAGIAGFIVVVLAFIAFILPFIVRSQAISHIEQATGRKLRIASVSINPLTWRAEVRGVRFSEKDPAVTFVSFSSVRVSLSPASIYRRAPILREIAVTSPYVRIVRTAPNTFNFSDLMKKEPQPAPKKESSARFSLNNITVVRGACDFIDRAIPREKSHRLRDIEVGIPFVSNIPYLADRYVLPRVRATVNGSPFVAEGRLKPFERSAETVLDVNLRDVDLPFYYGYVPATLPFLVDSGKLSTKLEITYRVAAAEKPDLIVAGSAGVRGLAVNERGGERLVRLPAALVRISRAGVISGNFDLAELSLDGLELFVSRDRSGKWTHQRLFPEMAELAEEAPEPEKSEKRPPALTLAKGALKQAKLHFADAVPPGGFATVVTADFGIERFRTDSPVPAVVSLSLASERKEAISFSGTFAAKPLALQGDAALSRIPLEAYYPYLAPFLASPLWGTLSGGAAVGAGGGDVALHGGKLVLAGFGASFNDKEGAKLSRIAIDGIDLSLKERRAEIAAVTLADGSVTLSRMPDGKLSPLALLKSAPKKPGIAPAKGKGSRKTKGEPPFRYSVKKISGSGLAVSFTDRTKEEAPVFPLRRISFSAGPVTGPTIAPIGYRFASLYGSSGKLESAGTVRVDPLHFKGTCRLASIPIRDFEGYFPEDLLVTVADGSLDLTGSAEISKGKAGLSGRFSGDAGVRNFHALGAEDEDLLKWESLQLDGISGTIDPPSLRLQEVALNNFYVKIQVDRDGTLNLRNVREQQEQKAAPPATPPPSPPVAVAAAPAGKPQRAVQVDTVVIQDGVVDFTDRHLPRQYRSTMVNLGGRISGLSSEAARYADVDLRGNLENHSPLRITGKINPLRDDLFVDLKVSFTDIDLSPMTPYSGTYLGYSVDKGKLFLDLAYKIEQKKLEASNRVFIDQFTFGQAVESDKATNLPVRLAVALLKDRKGEIHLDLPVAGRTDDPKFSIWGVVFQMLKNLLVKAATSPFALLGSAFGGKDDFAGVPFAYGSANLKPAEREKLTRLAAVLRDRPGLKLEVSGFVDREHDPEGYRSELLLRKMKAEKFMEMVRERKELEGKTAETVDISGSEMPKLLKAVYLKEKFPKPRTFIGTVKDIPDPEKRKLILANTVVTDEDLQSLARDRAAAVREYLVGEGKLEPERIFIKGGDVFRKNAKEGEAGSRVEFGIAAR